MNPQVVAGEEARGEGAPCWGGKKVVIDGNKKEALFFGKERQSRGMATS